MEANTPEEAKNNVIDLLKTKPEYFISVEVDTPRVEPKPEPKKRGVLSQIIWG